MSEQPEAPKKIWLEYWPDEHFVYLTDDLVSTGYLTEYVRADYHERLVEALRLIKRVAGRDPVDKAILNIADDALEEKWRSDHD